MRRFVLFPCIFMLLLAGCDTSSTNPGHHSPEEISNAKPKPVAPAAAPTASMGGSLNGQELYNQYCGICHKDGKNGAPPLYGVMNRRELPSGTPATPARLADTIKMGRANMPAFANTLSDEQISAIVEYVKTL